MVCLPWIIGQTEGDDRVRDSKEYLVGVYYFAGWWKEFPTKYHIGGGDWRPAYPERRALLGEFNDQATMDKEITAATSHGVDFFQILWYYVDKVDRTKPQLKHVDRLNDGVRFFMASRSRPPWPASSITTTPSRTALL